MNYVSHISDAKWPPLLEGVLVRSHYAGTMFAKNRETLKITSINSSLKTLERTSTVINASQTACPRLLKLETEDSKC